MGKTAAPKANTKTLMIQTRKSSGDGEREYKRTVFGSITGSVLFLFHFGVFKRSQQLLADSAQASHHDPFGCLAARNLFFGLRDALADAGENRLQQRCCIWSKSAECGHSAGFEIKSGGAAVRPICVHLYGLPSVRTPRRLDNILCYGGMRPLC